MQILNYFPLINKYKYVVNNNTSLFIKCLKLHLKNVCHFKCLNTVSSQKIILMLKANRLVIANKCYYVLRNQFKYLLTIRTKIKLYKATLRPISLYGSKCWTLIDQENKYYIFEWMILLRRICEPMLDKRFGIFVIIMSFIRLLKSKCCTGN